ncbi:phospho-N-acetylmuramoyl-pentapeptide-transferase [Eremococcus coleocola]|uniref:Phospho-N-acetylmuramoyl-pentapeptide-transferase n=1 Tax=Eremococcus coleocola ACS-139-V-Col8 TaxID=908337 RepID=E4KP66_9LACT|nr:phospho-N-acetylmuramoyl-pentapeptide-transferase [Eremococcus coleocola]EFR30977.1 phospho-N-acetylmuramoyl-pentapeptide-transferase [Eremococcus coleocola ACS-139-V-Col8]
MNLNILSFIIAFALTVIIMPFFIRVFIRKKIGQTTREEGPLWHEVKTGTPTMGGTVFVAAILITLLALALFSQHSNGYLFMTLLTFLLFGGIGFVDDFISIFKHQNEGLKAKQKFLLQILFSILVVFVGRHLGANLSFSLFSWQINVLILLSLFAFFWITGFSNAVNLTDGLDGLATGLSIIAYSTYAYIAWSDKNETILLVCLTVVGALLAFLIFNHKPAKIFMGDVGSLALGAGLAVISLALNRPFSLLLIGLVFVLETASVIIQVASFKLRGKRVFKMSPIHHHFEMSGWSETKVVLVFWLCGLLASLLYLIVLYL